MKEILFSLDFLLCLAAALLGIMITIGWRKNEGRAYSSSLLFFLVFFSAYGLYGIWGQQFLTHVLTPVEDPILLERISRFLNFLGIPFLVTAWFMLLKFALDLRRIPLHSYVVLAFFLVNTVCILLSWIFLVTFPAGSVIRDSGRIFQAAFNFLYFFLAGTIIIIPGEWRQRYRSGFSIALLAILLDMAGVTVSVPLLFMGNHWASDLGITLLFFIGMVIPVIYLWVQPLTSKPCATEPSVVMELPGFNAFCRRYEISPREAEIIRELCKGQTNQQIADRLFITLQTVKDHLYRIYIKTEVNSRVQLVNLVRENKEV